MPVDIAEISELIAEGRKFTWDNFAEKNRRHGGADVLSVAWLVWLDRVNAVTAQMEPSVIKSMIVEGASTKLVGYAEDTFERAKKLLLNGLEAVVVRSNRTIPASDRVVSLGHNSPEQQQALEKLDELVAAVKETNDFPGEPEEREQIVAELSAGRRLLEAARVRVAAVRETLGPALKWISEKAGGAVIGKLAADFWQYLSHLHIF
ncbi:hypothetical protein [Bradyrhizobium sp. NBAIM01]|uniref:hypothetical protein n=1 Tax=Bradyrhizobium sp. NBAIM01 TaxID=2793818 RepID=UPI001CD28DC6|nr:hypothetical protein [Bradyrhizobium sp. NBAIM01]MCA1514564.1 hypothetical protein [Bradyrhizobium sp. NBAIM01]